jgi:hypothetical protein
MGSILRSYWWMVSIVIVLSLIVWLAVTSPKCPPPDRFNHIAMEYDTSNGLPPGADPGCPNPSGT